jgi:TonB family protein
MGSRRLLGIICFASFALIASLASSSAQNTEISLAAVTRPKWIAGTNQIPALPDEAKQRGVTGVVTLAVRINESGSVEKITILTPLDPKLDELAVNTVRGWRYQPGKFGGRTYSTTIYESIPFGSVILGGAPPPLSPPFAVPTGLAAARDGSIYVADASRSLIYKIPADGRSMTLFAGDGADDFGGDGGPALSAHLNRPYDMAVDAAGNLFVADVGNSRIRKITPAGIISTVAGNGVGGWSGDGGAATSAALNKPLGVAVDVTGTLYIADTGNARVRAVSPDGIIRTIAGTESGVPYDVAADASRNVYVADPQNGRVRKIDAHGTVTTFLSSGPDITLGKGPAVKTDIVPFGLWIDANDVLYIADATLFRVLKVQSGIPSTINLDSMSVVLPSRVAADDRGNIFVADGVIGWVRKITTSRNISSFPATNVNPPIPQQR